MSLKKNRLILVTGGAGYKGSTLCRELLFRGYGVRVIDSLMHDVHSLSVLVNHPHFEFIKGDIANPKDLAKALDGVCDVIHLAAIVGDKACERNPKISIEVNYKATQSLADMAKKEKVNHFLFASTTSVYGVADISHLVTEEDEVNPVSLYTETKIDCERYLIQMAKDGNFYPAILRFSSAFGISGITRFDLTVNSFTYEALRDRKIIVFSQDAWRPFSHVLDMVRIYCRLLEIPKEEISGEIFNSGWNEYNYRKKDIINFIKEVIGEFEVDYISSIEDKRSYRVDFNKIKKILKFSPVMTVKDGITELAGAIKSGLLLEEDFEKNKLR